MPSPRARKPSKSVELTASQLSARMAELRLPVSVRAVTYHAKEAGCPVEVRRGIQRFRWPDYLAWWHTRDVTAATERARPTFATEAKLRKLAAEAELAELELAKERGQVIPIAVHGDRLARILERVRARLIAMPGTLAPQLVGLETAREAQARVEVVIGEVLTELARG